MFHVGMFFSPDGCALVCLGDESEIYLWKDSPTGIVKHGTLTPSTAYPKPLLSQNSKSIVAYGSYTIQLWHGTKGFPTSLPNGPTHDPMVNKGFVLDLSPDSMLAVITLRGGTVVKVLNLKSGVLQSTINAGMKVFGPGVIKDTAVLIGNQKVSA